MSFYVDDCLFLGRVCRSVVEQSKQLPKIFPPTVVPLVPSTSGSDALSRRPSTPTTAGSPVPRLRTATKNVENALLKQVRCERACGYVFVRLTPWSAASDVSQVVFIRALGVGRVGDEGAD